MRNYIGFLALFVGLCESYNGYGDVTGHANWHLIDHSQCGLSSQDRIIGGETASMGQFPWLVRLGYKGGYFSKSIRYGCGGSLINAMYVLTAAHCVTTMNSHSKLISIRLGEHDDTTNPDCYDKVCAPSVQDFVPVELIIHANYDNPINQNDIALIRLDRPAKINSYARPICLPHGKLLYKNLVGEIADVAGWGINNVRTSAASNILLHVKVPLLDRSQCAMAFREVAPIHSGQLCAGGMVGYDSCGGDSGGPLMKAENLDGIPRYFAVGLVSFGNKECGSKYPAVYTNTAYHMTWILDNIRA